MKLWQREDLYEAIYNAAVMVTGNQQTAHKIAKCAVTAYEEKHEVLIRITSESPPFVAGVVFSEDNVVVKAAPIVARWAMGKSPNELRAEVASRGLKATYVRTLTRLELENGG